MKQPVVTVTPPITADVTPEQIAKRVAKKREIAREFAARCEELIREIAAGAQVPWIKAVAAVEEFDAAMAKAEGRSAQQEQEQGR